MMSNLSFFSLMVVVFMFYLRNLCLFQGHEDFLLWLFLEFYSLTIMFRSVIHLELIFVKLVRSVSRCMFFCMWMSSFLGNFKTI